VVLDPKGMVSLKRLYRCIWSLLKKDDSKADRQFFFENCLSLLELFSNTWFVHQELSYPTPKVRLQIVVRAPVSYNLPSDL